VTTSRTANPRRRKTLATDVFTACYSAIMAAAALFDANSKDQRRRDLDHEIAQAKSTLADMLERSNARDLARVVMTPYPDAPDVRSIDTLDIFATLCSMPVGRLQDRLKGRQRRLASIHRLRQMLGVHWVMDPPREFQSTLDTCEAIVAAEDHAMDPAGREPLSDTHMRKITAMVVDLVQRLIEAAWLVTKAEVTQTDGATHNPDSSATMIEMLMAEGYPTFAHPGLNPAGTVEQRASLNEFGLNILNQWMGRHREPNAARICHNLLVCGVPPSIQNYNLLILGFAMLGEHKLGQAVVDSFLFMSHLKPTEATCLCLLHHYRLKGDVVGFQRMIKRMAGFDPRGIGLRRRTAKYVERERYDGEQDDGWADGPDIVVIQGYYVQQAPFTLNIAEAMMEGLLDFGLLHECAKILFVCMREGWGVSRDLMWRLFNLSLGLLDRTTVRIVVQGLLDNIEEASAMLLGPDGVGPEITRQLHYILTVWQATTLPGPGGWDVDTPEPEDWAMDTSGSGGWDMDTSELQELGASRTNPELEMLEANREKLDHLTTAIWLNEAFDYADKMSRCLSIMERQLSDDTLPLTERISKALRTFDATLSHPVAKLRRTERIHRVAKLDWLMSQVAIADYKIRDAETAICTALSRQTPRTLRRLKHFNRHVPIDARIGLARPYGTPGRREHLAAMCFRASQAIDARFKQAVWDALPEEWARQLASRRGRTGDASVARARKVLRGYLDELSREKAEGRLWVVDPFAALMESMPDMAFPTGKERRWAEGEAAAAGMVLPEELPPAREWHVGW